MKTPGSNKAAWTLVAFMLALCLVLPSVSEAELKPMSEGELKAIALNDFVRPSNILILQAETEDPFETYNYNTDTTVISAPETPILIDGERLIEDLMTQYESIQSGNGPIEGIYPVTFDPSYLIKQ